MNEQRIGNVRIVPLKERPFTFLKVLEKRKHILEQVRSFND